MFPHLSHFRSEVSGIATVVKQYFRLLPQFDIELVEPDADSYDLVVAHAGWTGPDCDVCMLHGMYWSADYNAPTWEYEVNSRIVEAVRHAKQVVVPSRWVAEVFQRDMRFTPHVIGHGVEWEEWKHKRPNQGYVLGYSKNRSGTDVCDPSFLNKLAPHFPHIEFLSTFTPNRAASNIRAIGTMPYEKFKRVVQGAAVYISPVKETFGIGTLEAMAAGIPVLGVKAGGNLDLIEHGLTGYLYEPDNYEDMAQGLDYCLKHRKVLGQNGQEAAKAWTWEEAAQRVAEVYRLAMVEEPPAVSVVIPVYNKTKEQVWRAIESCQNQTLKPEEIIIVNDGNPNVDFRSDYSLGIPTGLVSRPQIILIDQSNQGVANARNNGVARATSKYVACLDSDDAIAPRFLESCVAELEADRSLGIAYGGLWYVKANGEEGLSPWPGEWDYDAQLRGANQLPTCNVIRREAWQRLGGQRQRYAPSGAGEEDAELWLRMGAYGWKAKLIEPFPELLQVFNALKEHLRRPPTEQEIITQWGEANYQKAKDSVFIYSWLSGQVSGNKEHKITDYKVWHPWTNGGNHPFASYATPKNFSHPVTQFDQPEISVIIPVGPGHEKEVINALDSLEAQTFRKWEAVVVWDFETTLDATERIEYLKWFTKAYPYTRQILIDWVNGAKGAGHCRNRGAAIARAPLILFLDADDTLHPDALKKMLTRYNQTGEAIYTDYVGQAFIDNELATKLDREKRLQAYNPKSQEAIIDYQAFEFDCDRALLQPDSASPYIWNLITTLFPKRWHEEINGFDEAMETWEDWDYWLRMVQKGHCFTRLPERLVRYRFYTGQRRYLASGDTEEGRQKAEAMIEYIRNKYKGQGDMGCGCKKDNNSNGTAVAAELQAQGSRDFMADTNFVKAQYLGKRGNHHIWGDTIFETNPGPPARKAPGGGWRMYYGYSQQGLETTVHKQDIESRPGNWQIIPDQPRVVEAVRLPAPPVPVLQQFRQEIAGISKVSAPTLLAEEDVDGGFDLQQLPGVGAAIALRMISAGLNSRETILKAGLEGLTDVEGITNTRAVAIMRHLAGD